MFELKKNSLRTTSSCSLKKKSEKYFFHFDTLVSRLLCFKNKFLFRKQTISNSLLEHNCFFFLSFFSVNHFYLNITRLLLFDISKSVELCMNVFDYFLKIFFFKTKIQYIHNFRFVFHYLLFIITVL